MYIFHRCNQQRSENLTNTVECACNGLNDCACSSPNHDVDYNAEHLANYKGLAAPDDNVENTPNILITPPDLQSSSQIITTTEEYITAKIFRNYFPGNVTSNYFVAKIPRNELPGLPSFPYSFFATQTYSKIPVTESGERLGEGVVDGNVLYNLQSPAYKIKDDQLHKTVTLSTGNKDNEVYTFNTSPKSTSTENELFGTDTSSNDNFGRYKDGTSRSINQFHGVYKFETFPSNEAHDSQEGKFSSRSNGKIKEAETFLDSEEDRELPSSITTPTPQPNLKETNLTSTSSDVTQHDVKAFSIIQYQGNIKNSVDNVTEFLENLKKPLGHGENYATSYPNQNSVAFVIAVISLSFVLMMVSGILLVLLYRYRRKRKRKSAKATEKEVQGVSSISVTTRSIFHTPLPGK